MSNNLILFKLSILFTFLLNLGNLFTSTVSTVGLAPVSSTENHPDVLGKQHPQPVDPNHSRYIIPAAMLLCGAVIAATVVACCLWKKLKGTFPRQALQMDVITYSGEPRKLHNEHVFPPPKM